MKLDQARFPMNPSAGFDRRVLAAARLELRPTRPSLLPELLDGLGWTAAVWVGGFLLGVFFP
jgi:hypothetical protein